MQCLHNAREMKNEREEEYWKVKLEKHAEEVICTRQLVHDFHAQGSHRQGSHHQGSYHQGSHAPHQAVNKTARRVPSAFKDRPYLED